MWPLCPQHQLTHRGWEEKGVWRTAGRPWLGGGVSGVLPPSGVLPSGGPGGCRAAGASGWEHGGHESSGDVLSFRPVGHLGGSTQVGVQGKWVSGDPTGNSRKWEEGHGEAEEARWGARRRRGAGGAGALEEQVARSPLAHLPCWALGLRAGRGEEGRGQGRLRGWRLHAAAEGWHEMLPQNWGVRGVFRSLPSQPDACRGSRFLFCK